MKKRFVILILFSLFICMFGVSAGTFTWYGYVRWQNDSTVINATNITLTTLEMGGGTSYSNLSNAIGYFVIAGLDDTKEYSSSIIKYANHTTQTGNATGIGPILPPPAFIYQNELINATIYLKQAANIYLTAHNGSDGISFEYMVKDTKIGFPIAEKMGSAVYNASIPVQKDRNYSITLMPTGSSKSPPISVFANVSNYPSPYFVRKDINCSTTMIRVSGYLRNSSGDVVNGTLTNFTLKRHILESGNMLIEEFSLPADMGSWEGAGGPTDVLNETSAFYNITMPSVAAGFKVALVAYVNDSNGVWYAAFQNITLSGAGDREQNLTIRKLAGNYATGTYSNTSKVVISATNGSSAVSNAHVEVKLKYKDNDDNDFEFTWMTTTNTSGKIAIPLWQDYAIKKLAIYSSNYAPYKKKVKASLINSSTETVTATLKSFDPSSIDGEMFNKDLISIQFIISNSTCDVPEIFSSTHSCVAASDDNGELNPLKAMLRGKLSFRMIKQDAGIIVHYKNVDMMASGPPDALFDNEAADSSSGTAFEKLWRFGSSGPDVYDEVLIGINYSSMELDDSAPVKILLPYLYDDDWGIAWNVTANGTNGLAGNLTDYADFNMTWFNASTGGMTCYESTTANCYINKTLKMLWLTIPHFSGLAPTVDGYTVGNVSANTTAESFTCYGNCTVYINVTNNNYTLSASQQNITINNTDSAGNVLNWTVYKYDGNSFVYNFTNSTTHTDYNFTLYNSSNPMNSTHQYKLDIYRSANVTTQWNFTYNVSGMSDVLKLTMNLNCVASCKTWGAWGTCTGTGEIGTRTRTCSIYKYNCGDALSATENCFTSGSSTGSSGGGGSASYALSVNTETGPRTMTVKTSDSVNLYVNGDSHSFKVTKIYDDYITIMIKSEPKYYDISVNETKKIDIDTDGDIDLVVTLHEIVSNLRVRLTIEKFVSEEITEEVEEIETEEIVEEEEARELISKRFIKKVKTMSPWAWLIILVIAVLIILFVLSYRHKGKPGKGRVKRKKHQLIFNSFLFLSFYLN